MKQHFEILDDGTIVRGSPSRKSKTWLIVLLLLLVGGIGIGYYLNNTEEITEPATEEAVSELNVIEDPDDEIYVIVEELPSFPGGEEAMREFLRQNLRYPAIAQEIGIQGKVFVRFVVKKDGSISNASIVRGVHTSLDNEALRVIRSMPNWEPGEHKGQKVSVSYVIPVSFKLN